MSMLSLAQVNKLKSSAEEKKKFALANGLEDRSQQKLTENFQAYDRDNDGKVNAWELR